MGIEKVTFNPSASVLFMPDNTKQMVELNIDNPTDQPITFKMKSTRPGLYKMRPVYGLVCAGDKATVKLIYKGLKGNQTAPTKDRFTIIYTVAPSSSVNVQKMWTQHKYHTKLVSNDVKKHKLSVLYKGINDNVPQTDMFQDKDEDDETKKMRIKKTTSGLEEEERRRAAEAAAAAAAAGGQPAPAQKPLLLMYREAKPLLSDSESEKEDEEKDDEDDEEDKKKAGPVPSMPSAANRTPNVEDLARTAPLAANINKAGAKATAQKPPSREQSKTTNTAQPKTTTKK